MYRYDYHKRSKARDEPIIWNGRYPARGHVPPLHIPHGVRVEASFSQGRDVISWRQSKTRGENLHKKVVVREFTQANNGILAGTDTGLDTTDTENDSEMTKEAESRRSLTMAKVHDFLEMWQWSQNLSPTQEESHAQNKQIVGVGYISDMEEIIKASWSLFQHDASVAAFKLSERSPLPPALCAKDLPGGQTRMLNVRRMGNMNRHLLESDKDSANETISDSDDWQNWNGKLDNPNDSEEECAGDDQSNIQHNNCIEDPECPEQQDVRAPPDVPRLVRLTRMSKGQAEKVLVRGRCIVKAEK